MKSLSYSGLENQIALQKQKFDTWNLLFSLKTSNIRTSLLATAISTPSVIMTTVMDAAIKVNPLKFNFFNFYLKLYSYFRSTPIYLSQTI